jgi:two-component system, NtrC family, C4-dicarboxylate transport response regulator DctD
LVLSAGAERPRKLNLRIVVTRLLNDRSDAADDIRSMFHERLSAVRLMMAPLANRREDIAALFHNFLTKHEAELGLTHREVTDDVWQYLQTHEWTGNVREIEAFARTWAIGLPLPDKATQSAVDVRTLAQTVAEFEQTVIENALRAAGGNVLQLERLLGTPRKTLYDKLNRYGLRPKDFSQASASARTDPRVCR